MSEADKYQSSSTHVDDGSISLWAVGRYRFRIYRYAIGRVRGEFGTFVADNCTLAQVDFDSAPMKLFAAGRAKVVFL